VRLKQLPGDFRVVEDYHFTPDEQGEHYVHLLRKEKLDTLEALARVAHVAGVSRTQISFAGLKDRQGRTEQYISLPGIRVELNEPELKLRFVGRSAVAVSSKQSQGNRFRIVVRDLKLSDLARLRRNLPSLRKAGLPNYFDDQRFGCLRHGQGLIVRDLVQGNPERALFGLLAQPSPVSEGGDHRLKQILANHWGDWPACAQIARGPRFRPVFEHLVQRPDDFAGALNRVSQRIKLIHLYAFQSFVWNRAVSRYLERYVSRRERTWLRTLSGSLLAWRYLEGDIPKEFATCTLPLLAPEMEFEDRLFRAMNLEVLRQGNVSLPKLVRTAEAGMVFKEEPRNLVLHPADLVVSSPSADEENRQRSRVTLEFALPRGSYATLVVKRLFAEPPRPEDRDRQFGPRSGARRPRSRD
jgi:tRNA pseudouridine13 synthase